MISDYVLEAIEHVTGQKALYSVMNEVETFQKVDGDTVTSLTSEEEAAMRTRYDEIVAEIPMRELRRVRNLLLAETDWWASSDLTMTAEQTAYRQALRDITQTYTSLEDVVWPTKPEV